MFILVSQSVYTILSDSGQISSKQLFTSFLFFSSKSLKLEINKIRNRMREFLHEKLDRKASSSFNFILRFRFFTLAAGWWETLLLHIVHSIYEVPTGILGMPVSSVGVLYKKQQKDTKPNTLVELTGFFYFPSLNVLGEFKS